ncbi:hypothetical protein [Microvirga flavescens]|uniref:hypothetical protein n=1 Tax=Microvirga flavescens TaxID=2249811 RepID=UPI000DD5304A|nr:hypothetical protein [Microvirga flavescens]
MNQRTNTPEAETMEEPFVALHTESLDARRLLDLLDQLNETTVAKAWMQFMVARAYFALTDNRNVSRADKTRILKMLARSAGISTTRLHALLNQYFYARSIDAFLPMTENDGRRVDPRVEEIIAEEIERAQGAPQPQTRVALMAQIRQRCQEEGLNPPARNTILMRIRLSLL